MNIEECLVELTNIENKQSKMNNEEFFRMIEDVSKDLVGSYKTRINKLAFIAEDNDIPDMDIPF